MSTTPQKNLSRRRFLASGTCAAAAITANAAAPETSRHDHEARFYIKLDNDKVQCELCPRYCEILPGERGTCGARENRDGKLHTLVYGRPVAMHNDPIEKKPFFHVYPGSKAFSIATVGCNMHCKFCQNWDISQKRPEEMPVQYIPPSDIARLAVHNKSRTVAYTYTEPTIFTEYMIDCAKAVRDAGIGNVVVSNGYINEEPQKELMKVIDAYKVDLKAFSQQFYGRYCGGNLKRVLETLQRLAESGVWYEIVVLVIPTLNDDMDEIKRMCEWIVSNLGPNVPVHFTRFQPQYKMRNLPPTPPKTLEKARKTALGAGCNFVYGGNMPGTGGETLCPRCKKVVVRRYGHMMISNALKEGKCEHCGADVPGLWF